MQYMEARFGNCFPRRESFMVKKDTGFVRARVKSRIVQSLVGVYLSQSRWIWSSLPLFVRHLPLVHAYAKHLRHLVCIHANRGQQFATFFCAIVLN